jgi:hypothetical protein
MRQSVIMLAIAGAVIAPASFAQSMQASDARGSTADAASASRDVVPVSKAHRAMASFNSLLREAARQSQAMQPAPIATQRAAHPVQPASDAGDALASTPDPVAVH